MPFTNNLFRYKILKRTMIRKEWDTIIKIFDKFTYINQIENKFR